MIGSASALPAAVIYLILVFLQGFGESDAIAVDYLQDGVPELEIAASAEREDAGLVYRIVARPAELAASGEQELPRTGEVRVEQSDLVSQNYLLYADGGALPTVVTLEPVLAQLATAASPRDLTLELPEADVTLGTTLHVLRRDGTTVLSAPEAGITLLIEYE
ncbi:MAG: hypothetical protein ACOC2D_00770 [Spirochaetota bacterium]